MSSQNDFVTFVTEQLRGIGRVHSRRMFGGFGLYSGDRFFAIIADDVLYLKVDASNRADYLARKCEPFAPFPDKMKAIMSYYNAPSDLLDDSEELCRWARKSVDVAEAGARSKLKSSAKKSRATHVGTKKAKSTHIRSSKKPGNSKRLAVRRQK